jgi:hypothetical protein
VRTLLHDPRVTVDEHARFEDQPAIRLYSAAAEETLYVQPGTYRPLGVVMITPADGHNGPKGRLYQQVGAFTTWQILPDGVGPDSEPRPVAPDRQGQSRDVT